MVVNCKVKAYWTRVQIPSVPPKIQSESASRRRRPKITSEMLTAWIVFLMGLFLDSTVRVIE